LREEAAALHIVIPVKRFACAKQRLADRLAPAVRHALARAMLLDVLDALAPLRRVDGVVLVSDEPELARWRHGGNLERIEPLAAGLNEAVEQAIATLAVRGLERALVLHSDVPLADTAELQSLVDDRSDLVLVGDRHARGTNAMGVDCRRAPRFAFGPDSLARHVAHARDGGQVPTIRALPSIALDIDDADDIAALLAADRTGRRRATAILRQRNAGRVRSPACGRAFADISSGSVRSTDGTHA
jgi:2-phospho-L-lactate guanylyltransferase